MELIVGLDVGSTTVKGVVIDPGSDKILWSDYQRHETRQGDKAYEFLCQIESQFPGDTLRIFMTGSGGSTLAPLIGAKFVQEVNAVSLAIENFFPDAGSVVELGGQDAKIILWLADEKTGKKRKLPSMNDKCAGGTGAVIDKIRAKLNLSVQELASLRYDPENLHPVAGKCGVFAETDINGLQKQGVPTHQLMNSLFEALVQQNLSVLTRGNTLRPKVLLLGGPNTFIPALQEAWRFNILNLWKERKIALPEGVEPSSLIQVPENAQYYGALGCALLGKGEAPTEGRYAGSARLKEFIQQGRTEIKLKVGDRGLCAGLEELAKFQESYKPVSFLPPAFRKGEAVEGYLGIDAGSTSTKAVLIDPQGRVVARSYRLSQGNPLEDTQGVVKSLVRSVEESTGLLPRLLGVATTGYAKDMLRETIGADLALVETVAHTQAALHFFPEADVIVDIGGQDIKVITLKNGQVKDFKLNTQCSAGNGYFLQNTAEKFGIKVEDYAEHAFSAGVAPIFNFGCAVFLESDIVNFQQLGWEPKEIMAGLAQVLPRNIWLYVVQEPNLRKLGKSFILQGGTQRNMAAVKAQVDFIKTRVPEAEVHVHPFTGESGALGAALEARRSVSAPSKFIGLEALSNLEFSSTRDESTRCHFCKNLCLRTFIDTRTPQGEDRRFIIATCEKGTVEDLSEMKKIKADLDRVKLGNPNFVEAASKEAYYSFKPEKVAAAGGSPFFPWTVPTPEEVENRAKLRIGMPRALNMYSLTPFFTAYFESLGLPPKQLVFSDYTSEKLYKDGSRRGAIDPCFPSKVALAHVHQLLFHKKVDLIFFPCIFDLKTELKNTQGWNACPTVSATPEVVKAALTKEQDLFAEKGVSYLDPVLNMAEPELLEKQMFDAFREKLSLRRGENRRAVEAGLKALQQFHASLRSRAKEVIASLEEEKRLGIVLLGRPYHNDPGLNHGILEELQKAGYPIFTVDSLPQDPEDLERLFGEEIREGHFGSAMDISDVWKNSFSENSNKKVWGAKYVARHPNLVAIDLSNFKCGHDSPIYHTVESIVEATHTPYFTFHEIDENKPAGSIKIRVETIRYFLKRYEDEVLKEMGTGKGEKTVSSVQQKQMVLPLIH